MDDHAMNTDWWEDKYGVVYAPGLTIPSPPDYSEYEVQFFHWTYCPEKKNLPNWFHRKMQEIFFGMKWRKK